MFASAQVLSAQTVPDMHQSRLFAPPGRPRPLARRLAIHNRVVRRVRSTLEAAGFQEIPASGPEPLSVLDAMIERGFPALWCEHQVQGPPDATGQRQLPVYRVITARSTAHGLNELADLMENLLKDVTGALGAELLGGMQVTRLDRSLHSPHLRLRHSEAVAVAHGRGWEVGPGDDLPPDVEAALVRHGGNLPLLVTHWPTALKAGLVTCEPGVSARIKYLAPYAGEIMDGGIEDGAMPRAGFSLGIGRLLQYLMGLGSIADTEILPRMAKPSAQARA